MADYLVVTGDNPNLVILVKGKKHRNDALDSLDLQPGDKATVYRVASVSSVKVVEETVRKVVEE